MKNVLILGAISSYEGGKEAARLMASFVQDGLDEQGVKATTYFCQLDELGYVIKDGDGQLIDLKNGRDLSDYGFVYFRGKLAQSLNIAALASQYLKQRGVKHANSFYGSRRPIGKISQMYQLTSLGLPLPDTVCAGSKHLPGLISKYLHYPVIVKDVKGAHGSDNHLVKDDAELRGILAKSPEIEFMAQEFIPNKGDYRLLILGSELLVILRQSNEGSHLNNTSVGGKASLVSADSINQEIIEQSRRFAEYCEYEIAGVDVIVDSGTGKHYFLEINSQPQLATGAFTAEKQALLGKYFSRLLG